MKKIDRAETERRIKNRFIIMTNILQQGMDYINYVLDECPNWSVEDHINSVGTGFNN